MIEPPWSSFSKGLIEVFGYFAEINLFDSVTHLAVHDRPYDDLLPAISTRSRSKAGGWFFVCLLPKLPKPTTPFVVALVASNGSQLAVIL